MTFWVRRVEVNGGRSYFLNLMLVLKLLLLDEPYLGLYPNYILDVFERIEEINKDGTTVLLVEQNAKMALEYADKAYVFKIGEIAM